MEKEIATKNQLLFLHGYLADKRSFSYQYPYFERNFDIYPIDLKGFGENVGMEYAYSLDDYIQEVKEFCYKNSIVKPSVIAHSFGGRIAIKLSATEKDFFNKLVLTGSAGLKPRYSLKKKVKGLVYKGLKPFVKKEKLEKLYSSDYNKLDSVMKKSFIKIVNEHLDGYLSQIENPTLLVYGELDKETPLYMARRLNKNIKNSTLKIYQRAGHFCFIDKPLKFNLEVEEFLLS